MDNTRELNALKRTEHLLNMRLMELHRLEAKARRGWAESKGAEGYLDLWTAAITRSNETASALYYLQTIIREIEGN